MLYPNRIDANTYKFGVDLRGRGSTWEGNRYIMFYYVNPRRDTPNWPTELYLVRTQFSAHSG